MRYLTIFIFIAILVVSCKRVSKTFDSIDLSVTKSYSAGVYCFKVHNDGTTFIYHCDGFKRKHYYRLKMNTKQLDSISNMTQLIINSNIDSVYMGPGGDSFENVVLFINTIDNKYKFHLIGVDYKYAHIKLIETFTRFLLDIAYKNKKSTDSDFKFDSYSPCLFPPPPSNEDKFEADYYQDHP